LNLYPIQRTFLMIAEFLIACWILCELLDVEIVLGINWRFNCVRFYFPIYLFIYCWLNFSGVACIMYYYFRTSLIVLCLLNNWFDLLESLGSIMRSKFWWSNDLH
jgi:hypothetical protein